MKSTNGTAILGSCLAGAFLWTAATLNAAAAAAVAVLEVERSTNAITWEKVVLNPSQLTTGGGVIQLMHDPRAFYRLMINDDRGAGFVTALLLSDAPVQTVEIARQFLGDALTDDPEAPGIDSENTWLDVELGPVCYPVYDPAVNGGRTPAYIEFKVVRRPRPDTGPSPTSPFAMSPPDNTDIHCDFGYVLVATTTNDVPILSFAQNGPTQVEMLLRKARTSGPIKPVRYDQGLLIGEDAGGAVVCSIGNEPFWIDPSILSIAGRQFEGMEDETVTVDDGGPSFPVRAYASYEAFKSDYLSNPLYVEARRLRAVEAASDWKAFLGIDPEIIRVPLGERTVVLETRQVSSAEVGDAAIATATVPTSGNGLLVTGLGNGGTALEVTFSDGGKEVYLLHVGSGPVGGAGLNAATAGWTGWSSWYAGAWGDQRQYSQFNKDSQMCPNGWSGCGPAAWGMLFGWWDLKGSPRLMKSTLQADAPLQQDDSVKDCNRYTFAQMGPFCVNGQAATMPWNMKLGRHWASFRGAGRSISWTWGAPYLSPGSISKAESSIRSGRPTIIGMGFYWHYPMAYGLKTRQYKTGKTVWKTERYLKCNMGWGGESAEWHNAKSTWFSTNARYW